MKFWYTTPCILTELYQRFGGNLLFLSSGQKRDDGGNWFLQNFGTFLLEYTASQSGKQ